MPPRPLRFDEAAPVPGPEPVERVNLVTKRRAEAHMTMIVVAQEMTIAAASGDRVLVIDRGGVVEQGPPGAVSRPPEDARTRDSLRKHPAGAQ